MKPAGNADRNGWASVLWVFLTLPLAVAAERIFLERVLKAQSDAAGQILLRQAAALDELTGGQLGLIRAALGLDAGQPFLRVLALEDPDARVLTAVRPAADAEPTSIRDPAFAAGAGAGVPRDPGARLFLQPDRQAGLLRASLALTPAGAAAGRSGGRLYLEFDVRAAEQAAWAERLAPAGWLP